MVTKLHRISKKGQVTIFVIIAIVIVAAVIGYFLLRGRLVTGGMPKEVLPVYDYFTSCVQDNTKIAASVMGMQAGYLELPEFSPGSQYMPFSNQLGFLGNSVPYWYYVSGNNIANEQIPSKEKMQQQLASYLEDRIKECDFRSFEAQGFVISRGEPKVNVNIQDNSIDVNVDMPMTISFENVTASQTKHAISVDSRLGKFYNDAVGIYNKEKNDLFLENYGLDVLRLYAPVDGVEMGCSPKVWSQQNVKQDIVNALEANTQTIKIKGNYYTLATQERKYFEQDAGVSLDSNENVNFLYLGDWPTKITVYPDDNPMVAQPVGLQEGLGILGFCYVPYHFVYDMAYPVLVQIYDGQEMFQFPVAVVIDKNQPRQAANIEGLPNAVPELCDHKNTQVNVHTYDTKLNPVEADIRFKCFDTSCYIGKTNTSGSEAYLSGMFPQCANGFIVASAEGYTTTKYLISTIQGGDAELILEKEYNLSLEVEKGGKKLENAYAVVTFTKDNSSVIASYPDQNSIKLSEGAYEIKAYVYSNSTINLQGSSTEKCVDVPKSGIAGIFGASDTKCFTMQIPDQVASSAVSGGGKAEYYMMDSDLGSGKKLVIDAQDFGVPSKVEDLQANYNKADNSGADVRFE